MPKAPKFFIMYKRAGYRVIINHNGDMIVRPSAVEASIHVAGAAHCTALRAVVLSRRYSFLIDRRTVASLCSLPVAHDACLFPALWC